MAVNSTRDVSSILKTSQQKAFSTGILTALLLAVLVWGSLRPTITTILDTNNKFEQKTRLLQKLKNQNANLTNLVAQKEDDKIKPVLEKLNYYFPSDGNFSLFVVNLNQIATKNNLRMTSVSFSANAARQISSDPIFQYQSFDPITFQVSLVGNTKDIYSFASYLESTPFLPKIIDVSYSPQKADPDKTNISVTVLLYKLRAPIT